MTDAPRYSTLGSMMHASVKIAREDIADDVFHENLLIQTTEGLMLVILAVGAGQAQAEAIRMILRRFPSASMAVYTVEAWVAVLTPDHPRWDDLRAGRIGVRDLPREDAKEVVTLIGETAGGEELFVTYEVHKDPDGHHRVADEPFLAEINGGEIGGEYWNRFRPMFPQRHAAKREDISRN